MGVRPPTGSTDEPAAVEFGIAALASHLEDGEVEFPAEAAHVVKALGDPEIPFAANGRSVALSRAIEDAGIDHVDSERELLDALHPVFESYREEVASGVLLRLKELLPF